MVLGLGEEAPVLQKVSGRVVDVVGVVDGDMQTKAPAAAVENALHTLPAPMDQALLRCSHGRLACEECFSTGRHVFIFPTSKSTLKGGQGLFHRPGCSRLLATLRKLHPTLPRAWSSTRIRVVTMDEARQLGYTTTAQCCTDFS